MLSYIVSLYKTYGGENMASITFRIPEEKKIMIDELAVAQDRDRSYILNQALDIYLEVMEWQLAHIKEGLRQAEAGEFAADDDVKAAFGLWKK
jgi:predicted transcriptional regulator